MTLVFYAGVATTLVGLAGIVWLLRRARRLRESQADDATVRAELRSLVILNIPISPVRSQCVPPHNSRL